MKMSVLSDANTGEFPQTKQGRFELDYGIWCTEMLTATETKGAVLEHTELEHWYPFVNNHCSRWNI